MNVDKQVLLSYRYLKYELEDHLGCLKGLETTYSVNCCFLEDVGIYRNMDGYGYRGADIRETTILILNRFKNGKWRYEY